MKNRSNLISLILPIVILVIAVFLDRAVDSLKKYAGTTFDFRPTIWAQLGLALLFALLIVALFQVVLVRGRPAPWVFSIHIALAIIVFLPLVFTYLVPFDPMLSILYGIRGPFMRPPGSYVGITAAVLFWVGITGLLARSKR
ncbi:MAG: hypothetical protein WD751_10415 [Anaerolineales bacterium]